MNVWNSISWGPPVTECFDPLSPWHSQGGGSVVIICDHYPSSDSFQFSWSLFNYSQLDVLSAACPSAVTAAPRCLPTMPWELNVVHTDCAGKPRQSTSTGNSHVCHPLSLHRVSTWLFQFICDLASFLPRYCQYHNDKALCNSWKEDNVWSERRLDDVWELQLFVQVCSKCPVACLL